MTDNDTAYPTMTRDERLAQRGDCPAPFPDTCPDVMTCPVHDDGTLFPDDPMPDNDTAYDAALAYARETGATDGKAAASWFFDGNTTDATYRAILRGIEDGDPEVLDKLPAPDLSGQWADSLTGPILTERALLETGWTRAAILAMADYGEALTAICAAYEDAFSQVVTDELTRVARYHVN